MKISGYELKLGGKGKLANVQCMHMFIGIVHKKGVGTFVPHCNAFPSLVYKRREGSLVKGLPILSLRGIPHRFMITSSSVLA